MALGAGIERSSHDSEINVGESRAVYPLPHRVDAMRTRFPKLVPERQAHTTSSAPRAARSSPAAT